jgi:hypothetical protein
MTKPLLLQFHDIHFLPKEEGLKFVLFKLTEGDKILGFDYGFADFKDGQFEKVGGHDRPLCTVVRWCSLPSPMLLLG